MLHFESWIENKLIITKKNVFFYLNIKFYSNPILINYFSLLQIDLMQISYYKKNDIQK